MTRKSRDRTKEFQAGIGLSAMLAAGVSLFGVADAQEAQPADEEQEIVVTGTLFTNRNVVAASPIISTTAQELTESGVITLEAALNQVPAFAPTGTAGTGGQGTGGHVTLNLRGLGSNRNLILLDGRRLPLGDISGNVDINFIPGSILSGVETITGGASAVYGSDAMSGVVNFRTLSNFNGIRADVQYGDSWKQDYQSINASLSMGSSFANDRGNAIVSLSFTDREGLQGLLRKEFYEFVTPSSFIGQGTFVPSATNLPSQTAVNSLFASYGVAGAVPNTLNLGFNDDGTLFTQTGARNYKGPTADGYAVIAGNVRMPVGQQVQYLNPLERRAVYGKFDYDFTSAITGYGQFFYVDSTVNTESGGNLTQFGSLTTIPVTNPFIPQSLRNLLATRTNAVAPFTWNGRYVGVPDKNWDENYTVQQYLLGLKGDLFLEDWTWDVFASHDTTDHLQTQHYAVLKSRVQTLLNAADGGASICTGGFNPFGRTNALALSDACERYISTTAANSEHLSQTNVQGLVQGSAFTLPAGEVSLAFLANYRRNTYRFEPSADLASQNIEAVIASAPSRGVVSVWDLAAQVDIPILKDAPLAYQLNVGAAYRYSDYNTSGGVEAYEGDIKWRPVEDLLIRAGYQRAVRAPNIGELFAAASGVQVPFGTPPGAIGDPCDIRSTARTGAGGAQVRTLCLAQGIPTAVIDNYIFPTTATGGVQSGNPNLLPETADTFNVGFIWTPSSDSPLLDGLSVSLDYYSIEIVDVISVVPGLTALSKCYNLDGSNASYSPTNQFCSLLQRDSNGLLQLITLPYLNLGGLKTSGIDLQLDWAADFADIGMDSVPGRINLSTGIAYTEEYAVQTLPNTPFQNFEGTNTIGAPRPQWKALTSARYDVGALELGVRWKHQGAMNDVTSVTTPATPGIGVGAYDLYDVFGSYELNDSWRIRAGINNVMDHNIVFVSSSQTSSDPATFDIVGRQFYVGVSVDLN